MAGHLTMSGQSWNLSLETNLCVKVILTSIWPGYCIDLETSYDQCKLKLIWVIIMTGNIWPAVISNPAGSNDISNQDFKKGKIISLTYITVCGKKSSFESKNRKELVKPTVSAVSSYCMLWYLEFNIKWL